jgi:undecaprenyl-diphosphatase
MLLIQVVVLGIIQGLTEFLPISSSGHLLLVRELTGWELLQDPHLNTIFDVALHAGTFFALLVYFRADIIRLFRGFISSLPHGIKGDPDRRLPWLIVFGTVPAAIAGVAGEDTIEDLLRQTPELIAALLIAFGLLLWLAEWRGRKVRQLSDASWWDGILVGVAQAMALAPGVSRSGITITAGLARGMTRETAARFSFLLSIPIVGGAALYSFVGLAREPIALPAGSTLVFIVGMLAAAVSGYLCIRYFLRYLQKRALAPFVIYRVILGIALLAWFGLHTG